MNLFTASVQPGRGRGGTIGFRTLNLRPLQRVELEEGVYATTLCTDLSNIPLQSVMHVGTRPTFCDTYSIEVHCYDYVFQETPNTVTVEIVKKIRDTRTFANAIELAEEIKNDIASAKKIFR